MDDEIATDNDLIAVLNCIHHDARTWVDHLRNEEARNSYDLKRGTDIKAAANKVQNVMERHPEFKIAESRFFGQKQLFLYPEVQCLNIIKRSVEYSVSESVEWYRYVLGLKECDLDIYAEVSGLILKNTIKLDNDVRIFSPEDIPTTGFFKNFHASSIPRPLAYRTKIDFITFAHVGYSQVYSIDPPDDKKEPLHISITEKIRKTVETFCLSANVSPIVRIWWIEYRDPMLAYAEHGRLIGGSLSDGGSDNAIAYQVTDDDVKTVNQVLSLSGPLRNICDLAISRLNIGKRYKSPGSRAIEGGICLEALLGDGGSEITHKISVRTAMILAESLEDRQAIMKKIKEFYKLRSKTVHGVPLDLKKWNENMLLSREGLDICARLIKKFIQMKNVPSFENLDLMGRLE